jgi:DNA-binding MarR family transcriptional regulator
MPILADIYMLCFQLKKANQEITKKQGQYLAFILYYSKINRRAPAEADIQRYFRVSPPTVHRMVLTLEHAGLIERHPGLARSIKIIIPPEEIPDLE